MSRQERLERIHAEIDLENALTILIGSVIRNKKGRPEKTNTYTFNPQPKKRSGRKFSS
jgi:hypothetical protein